MTTEYFILLLKDCISLLTPRFVVPHSSETDFLATSPHCSLLLLLSDVFSFLNSIPVQSTKFKQTYQPVALKIRFYVSQVLSPSPLVFSADGVRFIISELETELNKRASEVVPEIDVSAIKNTRLASKQPGRTALIEELGLK
jgi:hypothetical protein